MDAVHNSALLPPGGIRPPDAPAAPARGGAAPAPDGPAFADVLRREHTALHFSGHARARIERRGIDVGDGTLGRLHAAVDRAAGKGAREAVVFVDRTAFVVSVANRTVITAVDPEHMREHVFTNIDSAVIA